MVKKIGHKEDLARKATCKKCGAILEYWHKDVKSYVSHCYDGSSDTCYYIECCECNNKVSVKGWY